MFVGETGDLEVEAGVVYEDYGVGLPFENVFLAETQVAQDTAEPADDFYNAHHGIVPVVPDYGASDSGHFPSAPEAYVA